MLTFAAIAGLVIILAVLQDAFETVVLPRRITRHFRLTAWFYRNTWRPWLKLARRIHSPNRREAFLSYFGPLSLILLLVFWAAGLIFGFALLQYGAGEHVKLGDEPVTFGILVYHSGETFFTLGYGDIVPSNGPARALAVLEAGMGFAFLGVVIGYLPVVYQAFSVRELEISMLDSRAGSPPSASELLSRLGCCPDQFVLDQVFRDWEHWSADLLANHLSYPVLSFFRSQHSNQSWLGALTVMLDVTALVMAGIDGIRTDQAQLTFAMARHAAVDLAQVVNARYDSYTHNRLSQEELDGLRKALAASGLNLHSDAAAEQKLAKLRSMYEPYIQAIARNLLITLPSWVPAEKKRDNWQGGPWDKIIQAKGLGELGGRPRVRDEHF
ncbi:MAG: two pore domain potassium channel family protein [Acidobacteriia bacterium]|nr:two pore domain potassium channel family protein [Terriglobia bacterium]